MTNTAALNVKALKAVNLFASKEESRYHLNGVLVTVTARAALYVATDDHRMLVHREELAEGAEHNTLLGSWIVPSTAIEAIKGGTGRFADAPATLAEVGDGEFRLDAPKSCTIFRPIDGSFPDWHRVIPRAADKEEKPAHQQFNLHYGASFAKAAELLGYETLSPHFHAAPLGFPIPVTFGGGDRQTFGVLMPVRSSADAWQGLPVWAGGTPPKAEEPAAIEPHAIAAE